MITRTLTGPAPRLKTPPHTCDTHIHFYDKRFLALPGTPSPADASVSEYRQVMDWLGIERVVVVQPNAYGDDNTLIMNAVAELGDCARAAVVVKPGVSDAELARLTESGARALRFMNLHGGTLPLEHLDEMTARIIPFGWHAVVQLDGRQLPDYEAQLLRLKCPFVIDHTGKFLEPVATDHASFKSLLRIVDTGRCWVKLSAVYETSKTGAPDYDDVGRLARALVKAAPERMLWASNWPHAQAEKFGYPDDAGLLDLLLDWAPDDQDRTKILATNPAELYGFPV
ncbi:MULTISPECIES: amidohydrolase family protein [Rhodomicrobium]|uniref:amidohydrolase family protein n=1 Tax=Rhodomicrobium TaxID=1068 RepID=UPI000B4ADA53|nr:MULTISPECIES: amidohydrolase family protein [Rhodomicrobium]